MDNYILKCCSKQTQLAIQNFCDIVNDCSGDVFVIMAQKSLCLYKLLVKLGMLEPKNVYSSTSIDFNIGNWDWSNKQIIILEDIIVSGSALSAATNRLKKVGVSTANLRIIAIARDTQYHSMEFTREDNNENLLICGMDCNDADCIELSYDISRLLSYYGIPYDTDYPSYAEIACDEKTIKKVFHSPMWDTYDITNVDNEDNQIKTLTLFPTSLLKSKLWNSINMKLDSHLHLKFRVYYSENSLKTTVVPMALLNEIKDTELLQIYDFLKANYFPDYNIDENWTTRTKFRFVQYYIAHKMMMLFYCELSEKTPELNKEWLSIQFGSISEKIYKILCCSTSDSVIAFFENSFSILEPDTFGFKSKSIEQFGSTEKYSQNEINELLLQPFKERHFKAEIPTREIIKKLNAHFTKDYKSIEEYSNRLRKGFSLNSLIKIFSGELSEFDCEKIISLFIDRAIDLGIIVPITYHNRVENYICRAYRHGEDLPFGESDKYRIVYFLKNLHDFCEYYNVKDDPATITLEKMIVLFIQMGLNHGNVFNRFLGFENYPILKERFCIHGAIATFFENNDEDLHIYTELETSIWVTTWLRDKALVHKKEEGRYSIDIEKIDKYLEENNSGNLSEEIKIVIENIADILSVWYSLHQNKRLDFKNNITALTSCFDKYTFSSAIVTEIHFFKRYWEKQVADNFEKIRRVTWGEKDTFFYNDIEQGLNSGREKYKWFVKGQAKKIISEVEKDLRSVRNANASLWKECTGNIRNTSENDIDEKTAEALGYLYFFSALYNWLVKGYLFNTADFQESANLPECVTEYLDQFNHFCNLSHRINNDLFNMFNEINRFKDINKRISFLEKRMKNILDYTESLISSIEEDIAKNSKSFTVRYQSCFIFDIKTQNDLNNDIIKLWESLDGNEYKTNLNIVDFGVVDGSYQRYGFFYNKGKNEDLLNSYLFSVFKKVRKSFVKYAYPTRAIIIPYIPPQVVMKHNTKEHISRYSNDFTKNFLDYISPYFKSECLHQAILVECESVKKLNIKPLIKQYRKIGEKEQISKIILPDKIYATNFYLLDKRKNLSCFDYSTVGVFCNERNPNSVSGTGVLIAHKNIIYCVTCQHLFDENTLGSTFIRLKSDNRRFKAKLLNKNEVPKGIFCPAQDDVLILQLEQKGLFEIDHDKVFSSDCIVSETQDKKFKVFGYPDPVGCIINNISFLGFGDNNYYLLKTPEERIERGFSGAVVVSSDKEKMLGMHSSHQQNTIRVIPIKQITKKIEKQRSKVK